MNYSNTSDYEFCFQTAPKMIMIGNIFHVSLNICTSIEREKEREMEWVGTNVNFIGKAFSFHTDVFPPLNKPFIVFWKYHTLTTMICW